jgi:hypothetical protein
MRHTLVEPPTYVTFEALIAKLGSELHTPAPPTTTAKS